MADNFKNYDTRLDSPAPNAIAVTESDSEDLSSFSRAIYIGGDGNLTVEMASGQEVTFTGLIAGTVLPIRVRKVKTATTATNIVALY
jgi:hypothetical protein